MKTDLRFERTEENLRASLLHLLNEKEFNKISVTAICRLAKCSRNAFYQHYETKEHLLEAIVDDIIEKVEQGCQPIADNLEYIREEDSKRYILNVLQAIDQYKDTILLLMSHEQMDFTQKLKNVLFNINYNNLTEVTANQEAFIHYFSGGLVSYIEYWLIETDMTLSEAAIRFHAISYNHPFIKTNSPQNNP